MLTSLVIDISGYAYKKLRIRSTKTITNKQQKVKTKKVHKVNR